MSDLREDRSDENLENRDEIREETRRIRRVQRVVAIAQQMIATQVQTKGEALAVIEGVKKYTLNLFPDGGETFELLYRPRLQRIYEDRFSRNSAVDRDGEK